MGFTENFLLFIESSQIFRQILVYFKFCPSENLAFAKREILRKIYILLQLHPISALNPVTTINNLII